jgi:hypothetical protein
MSQIEQARETSDESEAGVALGKMEALLVQERAALRLLDAEAVAHLNEQKLLVDQELRAARLEIHHRPSLERIRSMARHNQILMVRARDYVRGAIGILSGHKPSSPPTYSPLEHATLANTSPPDAVRLDVKV